MEAMKTEEKSYFLDFKNRILDGNESSRRFCFPDWNSSRVVDFYNEISTFMSSPFHHTHTLNSPNFPNPWDIFFFCLPFNFSPFAAAYDDKKSLKEIKNDLALSLQLLQHTRRRVKKFAPEIHIPKSAKMNKIWAKNFEHDNLTFTWASIYIVRTRTGEEKWGNKKRGNDFACGEKSQRLEAYEGEKLH